MKVVSCPGCGRGGAESLGQIPDCGEFAGQLVSPSIKGGELWRCKDCGSMFRYPALTPSEYLAFYEKASSGVWEGGESQRKDFAMIYAYLQNHISGSILDIGCYAGGFLAGLPGKFKKYGVEPSTSASDRAISKGINILGKTLIDLDSKLVFDVVVSIDVIEHVLDVETFLVDALAHVDKNGLLIISTGNPDSFFWRKLFKAKFWYCSYAEHLVFPSYKYFCEFSKRHNLPLPEQIRFKYIDFNFRALLFGIFHQLVFAISPTKYRAWIKLVRSLRGTAAPMAVDIPLGAAGVFTDHRLIIFRNGESNGVKRIGQAGLAENWTGCS
jgi:SAM-dependent methyltransferase